MFLTNKSTEVSIPCAFFSQSTCNHCRVNLTLFGKRTNCRDRGLQVGFTPLPCCAGYEGITRDPIGFGLYRVIVCAFIDTFIRNNQILFRQMFPRMREFVHQGKPETVDSILTKRYSDYRRTMGIEHGGTIKLGMWQDREHHKRDAFIGKELLCQPRPPLRPTQSCDIRQKIFVQCAVAPGTALLA